MRTNYLTGIVNVGKRTTSPIFPLTRFFSLANCFPRLSSNIYRELQVYSRRPNYFIDRPRQRQYHHNTMYIPKLQTVLAAGLALTSINPTGKEVASGKVMDYAVEKCIDADKNIRCSEPFIVKKSKCYNLKWATEGALSHTTVEVRDAGSDELVFYRDTDGEWKPEKNELVYLDFKPKIAGQANKTVEYTVETCD